MGQVIIYNDTPLCKYLLKRMGSRNYEVDKLYTMVVLLSLS